MIYVYFNEYNYSFHSFISIAFDAVGLMLILKYSLSNSLKVVITFSVSYSKSWDEFSHLWKCLTINLRLRPFSICLGYFITRYWLYISFDRVHFIIMMMTITVIIARFIINHYCQHLLNYALICAKPHLEYLTMDSLLVSNCLYSNLYSSFYLSIKHLVDK